jgi:hypothetical protein
MGAARVNGRGDRALDDTSIHGIIQWNTMYNDVVGPCTTLATCNVEYMSGLVMELGTVQERERIFG